MSYKFIDVSVWQKDINWLKVKAAGIKGAIIRYADGDTLDSKFDVNMAGAKAAGLHVGCYIFSRAKTAAQAKKEAERLYNAAVKYGPDMPLYIDLEAKGLEKTANTVAQAFIKKMDELGGKAGVYANLYWFNNYLAETLSKYSDRPMWLAQYNDKITHKYPNLFGMWQYSSKGSVSGIKGNVDMDQCFIPYWDNVVNVEYEVKDEPVNVLSAYPGILPSLELIKTTQEVIDDAVRWGVWIASDNRFHYGIEAGAHHNGCYFCETQPKSKKNSGMKEYKFSYCCNPFVGACWAHGGCVPQALKLCRSGRSWDFAKRRGYDASPLFKNLGDPMKVQLKKGDVLCCNTHVALYIGDGKIVHASGGDDNIPGSDKWKKSISIQEFKDAYHTKKKSWKRAHRFIGSINTTAVMRHGEVGKRIYNLQDYLKWYGFENLSVDGIFGDATFAAVKQFQQDQGLAADGIVGENTIAAMAAVRK